MEGRCFPVGDNIAVILSFLQAQTFLLHIKNPETVLKRGNVSGFRFFNLLIISHPARHHDTP